MEELHIFIIWENGRNLEDRIIDDISKQFSIIHCFEITWSQEKVAQNFTRFYGQNLPQNSYKEHECGDGPFKLVVILDKKPEYQLRNIGSGPTMVNSNIFDNKQKYREWTGGGHKIHASNTPKEAEHDLILLLGETPDQILNHYKNHQEKVSETKIDRDLTGANGWNSLEELFHTLNHSVQYVVVRGLNELISGQYVDHTDTDIFTNQYNDLWYIINGTSCRSLIRPKERIIIDGINYDLDIWDTGRNYIDIQWYNEMINTRVLHDYCYTLNENNFFYFLLYHCFVFKGKIAEDYKKTILKHYKNTDSDNLLEHLIDFLSDNGYEILRHNDSSTGFFIETPALKNYYNKLGNCISKTCCEQKDIGTGEILKWKSCVYENNNCIIKSGSRWIIDNEIKYLQLLSNRNYTPSIQKIIDIKNEKAIQIDRIPGLELYDFFQNKKNIRVKYLKSVLFQIISIINDLKESNIIHRDFCSQNVLINKDRNDCTVYIIDFGWAISLPPDKKMFRPINLAKGACPPEMYSDFYTIGESLKRIFPKPISYLDNVIERLQDIVWEDYIYGGDFSAKEKKLELAINGHFPCKDYIRLFFFRHKRIARYYHTMRHYILCISQNHERR
jgi:hypothetical protein